MTKLSGVEAYQATVIAKALEIYAKHKLRVNRTYTPAAMMAQAERLTGRTFKARDYLGAAKALRKEAGLEL